MTVIGSQAILDVAVKSLTVNGRSLTVGACVTVCRKQVGEYT